MTPDKVILTELFTLCVLLLSGMGKGQHRMPTKDELVQRYNRMNTIPPVREQHTTRLHTHTLSICQTYIVGYCGT